MTQNKYTSNNNPTLVAVSNQDGETPVYLYADPNSHAVNVNTANSMVSSAYDYIAATYPNSTTEVYTYKIGGSGGTTVSTVTVTYVDSTKANITSVSKT